MRNPLKMSIFVVDDKGESSYTPLSRGGWGCVNVEPGSPWPNKKQFIMVFHFDFAEVTSLSGVGFQKIIAPTMDEMLTQLEDLRKKGEIRTANHTVLMTGYMISKNGTVKKKESYELSYMNDSWMMRLKMPMPPKTLSLCR